MEKPKAQGQTTTQLPSQTEGGGNGVALAPANEVSSSASAVTTVACRTNLLKDIPAAEDAFSDPAQKTVGPHQTVADVIAAMIREPDAEGVSIGLEGTWGSGKTTVVKLLCEALEGDPDVRLIQFDAWAHEGDPLRRTFLETMIHRLKEGDKKGGEAGGWVNQDEWKQQLEKLANRKEITTTKDTPKVTGWGKVIGLSLLFVPLGGALFGQAMREPVTLSYTGVIAWKFIVEFVLGLLLSLAPLIILIPKKGRDSGVLELIINKGVTEKRTETDKTPNATSIEFEDYFKRLMEEALSKHPERRLVLVLDNLDRVDAKDALSIWATLQTFMQHKMDEDSLWYRQLWTLVLYDPKALSMLWKESGGATSDAALSTNGAGAAVAAETAATDAAPTGQNQQPTQPPATLAQNVRRSSIDAEPPGGMTEIAASFIDKSFQIRFEVSPPVPSNWYSFLLARLAEAFPGHVEEETQFHAVYRVLSIDRVLARQMAPTIRELKLYINQIGALHRQLALRGKCKGPDSIPLALMAYYVLLRRRRPHADIAAGVLKKELPEGDFDGLLGDKAGDKLAALHYNVDVSLARQVILGPSVQMALQDGKKDELIGYAENSKAFWKVLSDIIDEWIPSESIGISKTAYSLDDVRLLGSAAPYFTRRVLSKLSEAALKVTSWLPLDDVRANGLASLFNIIKDKEFAAALLERMALELAEPPEASPVSDIKIRDWVEKLRIVIAKINELNWPELYQQKVIKTLSRRLRAEEKQFLGSDLQRILELLHELGREAPDSPLDAPAARKALSSLVREGHVAKHLKLSEDAVTLSNFTTSWCLYLVIREDPKAAVPLLFKTSEPESEAYRQATEALERISEEASISFTSLLEHYSEWPLLFEMLEAGPVYYPLVMKSLSITVAEPVPENFTLDAEKFLEHWQLLQRQLEFRGVPATFGSLVKVMVEKAELVEKISEQGFKLERAKLYAKIYPIVEADSKFRVWLREGLEVLGTEEWEKQFREEGELLVLMGLFTADGVQFEKGSNYLEALTEYAKAILDENVKPAHGLNKLANVLNEKTTRREFRETLDNIFSMHITANNNVPPVFFDIFGSELVAAEHPYKSISALPQLFPTLLKTREMRGLEWVMNMIEAHSRLIDSSLPPHLGASFKDSIRQALSEEKDASITSILSEIAKPLNIPTLETALNSYEKIIERLIELGTDGYLAPLLLRKMLFETDFFSMPIDEIQADWSSARKETFKPQLEAMRPLQDELSMIARLGVVESEQEKFNKGVEVVLINSLNKAAQLAKEAALGESQEEAQDKSSTDQDSR